MIALFWRTTDRQAARIGRWKYLQDSGTDRLFDVLNDPGENQTSRADILRCSRKPALLTRRGTGRCCQGRLGEQPPTAARRSWLSSRPASHWFRCSRCSAAQGNESAIGRDVDRTLARKLRAQSAADLRGKAEQPSRLLHGECETWSVSQSWGNLLKSASRAASSRRSMPSRSATSLQHRWHATP
jgi:hypothetical protein